MNLLNNKKKIVNLWVLNVYYIAFFLDYLRISLSAILPPFFKVYVLKKKILYHLDRPK
jgi:hypothetical protein